MSFQVELARSVPTPPRTADEARARLLAALHGLGGGVVALSGGTDSALVVVAAAEVWGRERCVAVTSRSDSLAPRELDDARAQAAAAGVEHVVLAGHEVDLEAFRRNAPDRCFHCKDTLYGAARAEADRRGLPWVVDGANADDVGDHRPGLAARDRHRVRSPLLEAGLTKPWVRAVARAMGLPWWDKPAESCLSSRFPYGTEITHEGLARVRDAEEVVRSLGFRVVRVRVHDTVARIEVPPADLPALLADGLRERVVAGLKDLGFVYVTVDVEGFRSGSMNEALRPPPHDAGRPA
ncbi:MAG: ATP-dependent sacrificial sulfur transferase LarE [Planctomycetota bacterium]